MATSEQQQQQQQQEQQEKQQAQQQPQEVILDSLPYIDYSHPDYEAYAASLIEAEMATFRPEPDTIRLRHYGPNPLDSEPTFGCGGLASASTSASASSLAKSEYASLVGRKGGPRPANEAYDPSQHASAALREPPSDAHAPAESWSESINSAKINLESNRTRLLNLELQAEFESDVWPHYNATLETGPVKALQDMVAAQRARVDELNARRKTMQEDDAAPKLTRAGQRWEELVGGNVRVRDATMELEREVERLRREAAEQD